jgi:ferredoxin
MAYFITDTCIGCTVCELKCPVDTISGKSKELYIIHPEGCIDCGVCAIYCPVSCIQDQYGNLVTRIKPSQIPKAKVIVDDCTGCEFCVDICPFDCIHMIEDPTRTGAVHYKVAEVVADECVACRLCEIVCDKDAIIVPNAPTHRAAMLPSQLEKH